MDNPLAILDPLTEAERVAIQLRMAREGLSDDRMAETFGCTRPTLKRLLAGLPIRGKGVNLRAREWLQTTPAARELVTAGGQTE